MYVCGPAQAVIFMLRATWPLLLPDWQVTVTGHLPVLVVLGTFQVHVADPTTLVYLLPRPATWLLPSA